MKGTIKRVQPVVEVSEKFKKRELHLSVMDGQYEQIINVEFHQDNCAKLDDFGAGQEVEVEINIRGREWQKDDKSPIKVFNTLVGWKIEAVGNAPTDTTASGQKDDDLPF